MNDNDITISVNEHIRKESGKNFVINFLLNAGIAFVSFRGVSELSTWGEPGYGKDLILTSFLLSAILGGIFIGMFRRQRGKGLVLDEDARHSALFKLLPYNPWIAAVCLGIVGTVVSVPPLLGVFALLGVDTLTTASYAAIKGLWAGVLAAAIVPMAILQGIRPAPSLA